MNIDVRITQPCFIDTLVRELIKFIENKIKTLVGAISVCRNFSIIQCVPLSDAENSISVELKKKTLLND